MKKAMVRTLVLTASLELALALGCSSAKTNPGSELGTGGTSPTSCAAGQTQCGTECVDLSNSSAHCGQCGYACPGGSACTNGACACAPGLTSCNGVCTDLTSNANSCGACGNACPALQACVSSSCSCPTGSLACGGSCVDPNTDASNCGQCGKACQTGQLCQSGSCECLSGLTLCSGACVDTQSDANDCGQCGKSCNGQVCSLGTCKASCDTGLTLCGTSCVNEQTDSTNCGSCGHACAAGQQCSAGACACPAGQALCNGVCVDTQTSLSNCGACNTACSTGQSCTAGTCSCPSGQQLCNAQCTAVNTTLNCGSCGHACTGGQTCQSGNCACPSGQVLCSGTCATSCGTGGTGGTGGTTGGTGGTTGGTGGTTGGTGGTTGGTGGTTGGTGGTTGGTGGTTGGTGGTTGGTAGTGGVTQPTAVDLHCGSVTIAAADVISDFRQTTPIMYQTSTRGGTTWYAYGAEDSGTTKGASTPGVGSNVFSVDTANTGPCASGGSLHVSSTGNDNTVTSNGWGVGFGVNLEPDITGTSPPKKGIYNAQSAGYTGVGFWMKCDHEVDFTYLKVVDAPNDADVQNPVCNYSSGTICNQFGIKNETALTAWTYHKVYFAEALQDWEPATFSSGQVNAQQLTAFQIQVNTQYTRDGSTRVKNPFNCWVDDVHFLKDAPPSKNSNVTPKTCTTGTAAPGGYYTQSNRIYDCKTGQPKMFKGIARPSLEWDRAGWDITYEDLSRIQAWGANVIRFSLNQPFWQDSAKGPLYKRTVDRAVKWTLSLGMDVILDLHWTGTLTDYGQKDMANPQAVSFWQDVAQTYKNDGRVMFELYNEPFVGSGQVWRDGDGTHAGMQQMYGAVRSSAGALNLVMCGGLDWAYHLDQVLPTYALNPAVNVAYVTHPYQFKAPNSSSWDGAFGNLAATYPIIATEFGQANISQPGGTQTCDSTFYTSIINYFNGKNISWTAWAWHVERAITNSADTCGFPQLITSYSGTPNAAGTVVNAMMP